MTLQWNRKKSQVFQRTLPFSEDTCKDTVLSNAHLHAKRSSVCVRKRSQFVTLNKVPNASLSQLRVFPWANCKMRGRALPKELLQDRSDPDWNLQRRCKAWSVTVQFSFPRCCPAQEVISLQLLPSYFYDFSLIISPMLLSCVLRWAKKIISTFHCLL